MMEESGGVVEEHASPFFGCSCGPELVTFPEGARLYPSLLGAMPFPTSTEGVQVFIIQKDLATYRQLQIGKVKT